MRGLGVEFVILIAFMALGLVPIALGIWTAVDASRPPEWAFERAGTSKTLWIVLPIVGIAVCGIVTIVAAIAWFTSYKPRVLAAANASS